MVTNRTDPFAKSIFYLKKYKEMFEPPAKLQ